ncbi:unnamed protein product, partial [Polarella glacialis]
KLSFVDCSIEQIREAIGSEDSEAEFHEQFWRTVLAGTPSIEFRVLQNRTLSFWIKVFNRWQESGNFDSSKVPHRINLQQLSQLTNIPSSKCLGLVKLFDPNGFTRYSKEKTQANADKLKISMTEMITAGVLLSKLISSRQKLRFVFGLADLDDNRFLDEHQFGGVMALLIRGLCSAFAVLGDEGITPRTDDIRKIVKRLYERISALAARRLWEIALLGSQQDKATLAQAIRDRQAVAVAGAGAVAGAEAGAAKPSAKQLPFATLQDWCFGVFNDPLALPYMLLFGRFCPKEQGEDAGMFEVESDLVVLSHTGPAAIPPDADLADGKMLIRPEVITAREIFKYCVSLKNWEITPRDVMRDMGMDLNHDFWGILGEALKKTASESRRGFKPEFFVFLRKLCPIAQTKHLRMFQSWCQQYDDLAKLEEHAKNNRLALVTFKEENSMPVLSRNDIAILEKQFQAICPVGLGRNCISTKEMAQALNLPLQAVETQFAKFDISEDGYIDKHEFITMMCPPGHRLPSMMGVNRDILGSILASDTRMAFNRLTEDASKFSGSASAEKSSISSPLQLTMATPAAARKQVSQEMWIQWNMVFDDLDTDGNGTVDVQELKMSGLLSLDICEQVVRIIDGGSSGFDRRAFLAALLEATQTRRSGFCRGMTDELPQLTRKHWSGK